MRVSLRNHQEEFREAVRIVTRRVRTRRISVEAGGEKLAPIISPPLRTIFSTDLPAERLHSRLAILFSIVR